MHQKRLAAVLRSDPLGKLTALPRFLSWIYSKGIFVGTRKGTRPGEKGKDMSEGDRVGRRTGGGGGGSEWRVKRESREGEEKGRGKEVISPKVLVLKAGAYEAQSTSFSRRDGSNYCLN